MHEVFLQRLAAHPLLRKDMNFHVFLEYDKEVCCLCSVLFPRNRLDCFHKVEVTSEIKEGQIPNDYYYHLKLVVTRKSINIDYIYIYELILCIQANRYKMLLTTSCQFHMFVILIIIMPCLFSQLLVRGKNRKERLSGFFKNVSMSVDEVLLSSQKDGDEYFEHQRTFLIEYHNRVKDATLKSDKMTKSHKGK